MVQNFTQGLWHLVSLSSLDFYKQYLKLEPGPLQIYLSMSSIMWSIKILYGLISDNLPILGTRRKSYVILMGALLSACLMSIYVFEILQGPAVCALLTIAAMCTAFINVVMDAILCV